MIDSYQFRKKFKWVAESDISPYSRPRDYPTSWHFREAEGPSKLKVSRNNFSEKLKEARSPNKEICPAQRTFRVEDLKMALRCFSDFAEWTLTDSTASIIVIAFKRHFTVGLCP